MHNSSPLRQRYGSSVSQKGGRDEIPLSVPSLVGHPESLPGLGDSSASASYPLTLERVGRQSLALQTSVHGMAVRSDTLQSASSVATDAVYRSVRDLSQFAARALPLPFPRREGGRGRGTFPPVGVSGRAVCVSADPTVNSGTRPDSRVGAAGPFDSTSMAQTTVVQFSHRTVSGTCSASPPRPLPPPAGELDPPVIANVQPTRLDALRDSYRGQGFSARVADFLAVPVRPSTAQVYDRKWSIYCTWCTERQIDPILISVGDLADFFLHFFERVGLAAATIRAYKAAILSAQAEASFYRVSVIDVE